MILSILAICRGEQMNSDVWSKLDRMQRLTSLLTGILTDSMSFILRLGWMLGGFIFAVGTICYLSGIDELNGKKMLFSGFLLFMIFLYLDKGVWIDLFK